MAIVATILTQLVFSAVGHEDPLGEIDPTLQCAETGFRVFFERNISGKGRDSTIERIYDQSLKVVEDRQLSEQQALQLRDKRSRSKWEILYEGTWYFLEAAIQQRPIITAYRPNGIIEVLRLKWPNSVGYCAGFTVANDAIVIACNEHGSEDGDPFGFPPKDEGDLQMFAFSLKDLSHIGTFSLGQPSRIYSFPVCSELIQRNSKFYLGWVRSNPDSVGEWKHELVVSEWNPHSRKQAHHVVDDDTTWNGSLSMCACANQIVVAYHDQPAPHKDASIQIRKLSIQPGDEQDVADQRPAAVESKLK